MSPQPQCRCGGSGYDPAYLFDHPCTCPAQPFGLEPVRPAGSSRGISEFTKAEALVVDVNTIANVAEITTTIDGLLLWSSRTLDRLVGLAQWTTYVEAGGYVGVAARHVLDALDHVEVSAVELPGLIGEARTAAVRAKEDEAWA